MNELRVELNESSYSLLIGKGIASNIGITIRELNIGKKIGIVTDENVSRLYLDPIADSLSSSGYEVISSIISAGESSKSLPVVSELYDKFLGERFERGSALIALGGGVVGDITGFLASTLLRGVPFIQVPTTLLAQVDSSVGGKVGVNHKMGKNLIGSFYQPKVVIIDTGFLSSLPQREIMCGMAEVVKYGLILDENFSEFIFDNFSGIVDLSDHESVSKVIKRCVELKAEVVSKDEKESGLRRVLNFGHTIGHGVEAVVPRGSVTHGEAIAFGMRAAIRLSETLETLTSGEAEKALKMAKLIPLDNSLKSLDVEEITDAMRSDKKVKNGEISFVLLDKIGSTVFQTGIDEVMINKSIEFARDSI